MGDRSLNDFWRGVGGVGGPQKKIIQCWVRTSVGYNDLKVRMMQDQIPFRFPIVFFFLSFISFFV